jgi:hypothetical protein
VLGGGKYGLLLNRPVQDLTTNRRMVISCADGENNSAESGFLLKKRAPRRESPTQKSAPAPMPIMTVEYLRIDSMEILIASLK